VATKNTRVRLEFTAIKPPRGPRKYRINKNLSFLSVMLNERFGNKGEKAFQDWLAQTASLKEGAIR
jgi:hypothetical protein